MFYFDLILFFICLIQFTNIVFCVGHIEMPIVPKIHREKAKKPILKEAVL